MYTLIGLLDCIKMSLPNKIRKCSSQFSGSPSLSGKLTIPADDYVKSLRITPDSSPLHPCDTHSFLFCVLAFLPMFIVTFIQCVVFNKQEPR